MSENVSRVYLVFGIILNLRWHLAIVDSGLIWIVVKITYWNNNLARITRLLRSDCQLRNNFTRLKTGLPLIRLKICVEIIQILWKIVFV